MKALVAVAAFGLLAACRAEPAADDEAVTANEIALPEPATPADNEAAPANDAAPAPEPTPPASLPGDDTREPAPDLPLDKGVYVEPGVACGNPPNASWRIWNGEGLSGSSTHNCKASPVVQKGNDISVEQTCTDNYSGKASSRTFTLRIRDRQYFSQLGDGGSDQSFRLCAPADLPQWLREARR